MPEFLLLQKMAERLTVDTELAQYASDYAPPEIWQPYHGPQSDAFASTADWIGYGGAAGAGKTDLALGLAGLKHRRSLILRRLYPSMEGMINRSREIFNASGAEHRVDSFNEALHRWRLGDGRMVQFGSLPNENEWSKYRGNPYDLHVFDEASEFSESVIRSITAWNRTTVEGQACQVLLTFNPPTLESERWVITFFLPWMAYLFPKLEECKSYTGVPACPGELRYFIRDTKTNKDREVPAGTPGAKSRTFYPGNVADNPALLAQGYAETLESLPEPLRSQLRYGDFMAGSTPDAWQVIPTAWVDAAMARWQPSPSDGATLDGIGVDVARGGNDQTSIAYRWGQWFAELETYAGAATPDGQTVAGLVLQGYTGDPTVTIDSIGVGGSVVDQLADVVRVNAFNASASAGEATDSATGRMRFGNERARAWWQMREALHPLTGDTIALPPDPELRAELCSPRYIVRTGRIWVEDKDAIRKRIGRSTDKADAVIMAREESPTLLWSMGGNDND